ncbi:MAG: hypothetical protein CSA19_01485, partial [Deltaproteobacteria bacterium]
MSSHTKGVILGLIGVLIMSIESPIIKLSALSSFEVSFALGVSMFLSTNLFMLQKGLPYITKSYSIQSKGVFAIGISMGLGNFFFVLALIFAGVATTVLILATAPIFGALLTRLIFKRTTSMYLFIATFFIFLGLYVMLFNSSASVSYLGVFFAFLCTLSMTLTFALLTLYKDASRISHLSISALSLIILSVFFVSPTAMLKEGTTYVLALGFL